MKEKRIAIFISEEENAEVFLDLINNIKKKELKFDLYFFEKKYNFKEYKFRSYLRKAVSFFRKPKIYRNYDIAISYGTSKNALKYTLSIDNAKKIVFNFYNNEDKLLKKFDLEINDFTKFCYQDIKKFRKNLPSIKVYNEELIIATYKDKEELLDYVKEIDKDYKVIEFYNNEDIFKYLETDAYIYKNKNIEDLDNALKVYSLGSEIYEEERQDLIGIRSYELKHLANIKKKKKKLRNLKSYNHSVINNFLKVIE